MRQDKFHRICERILSHIRFVAPRDTGNLAENAIRMHYEGNKCIIEVDEAIAPYMPFTNEPWISPKWRGKKNPNEHWWQDTAENIDLIIRKEFKGKRNDRTD